MVFLRFYIDAHTKLFEKGCLFQYLIFDLIYVLFNGNLTRNRTFHRTSNIYEIIKP